jgi:two-component system cell cycle sensor histidine kinase/response regulator CckA
MRWKSNSDLFSNFHEGHSGRDLGKVLTDLVDFMDIAIWELDRNYRIVSCNHKASSTYGEDLVGRYCHSVTINSSTACPNCPVKKVYQTHKPNRAEQTHVDKNGSRIFVEHFATPIITEKGDISGVLVLLVDITEYKETEKKLQQHKAMLEKLARTKEAALAKSEGKFAVAFDASPDAININRLEDGLYVEVNKGFTELTGFTVEDVIGKTSREIDIWYDPDDRQRLVKRLKKYGYCENLEARFRRKDGSVTTALMSARIISVNDEPHIISITRDIGKLKKMERKVAAQQQLFETMFNTIEDGIVITNTQREIILANDGMKQTFGYSRKELLGMTTEQLYADQQGYQEAGKKIFSVAEDVPNAKYSQLYLHKSGREFPAATFAAKLHDREGQWLGNLGIMRDITEQQKSDKEREKLIAAVQQAGEVIVITDLQGTIEYVNPAFEEITGYLKEEVIGKNPNILKSGKHDKSFYQELWDTISRGETFKSRMVNKRKDGSVYTEEATISAVISAEGEIVNYVAVKRDITDQLNMEQQLRQAQKMEAIGRLTGGVAHDFNNMLGVILGYAELALDKLEPTDNIHDDLEKILDAAERSSAIVRQLLAFSRQQTIAPKRLDLNGAVTGTLKILRRLIGEDVELQWLPDPEPLPVKMDSSQMDQILANLCVNAKDAIKDNGTITIETGVTLFDEAYCSDHVGFQAGEYVMLAVSDDGIGIQEEDLDRVYEPFFTTKELGRGTGLGLSTVYGIVKQNHGFINIYSEPLHGTTVKIYLPFCYNTDEEVHQKKIPDEEMIQSATAKILVVEDDPQIRTMVQAMLTNFGYKVSTAESSRQAIQFVAENGLQFDLLLTDVIMPEMNGKELAKRLMEILPHLKCLYMSGYTTNVIVNKGVLSENVHFLQKPFGKDALAEKVKTVLQD